MTRILRLATPTATTADQALTQAQEWLETHGVKFHLGVARRNRIPAKWRKRVKHVAKRRADLYNGDGRRRYGGIARQWAEAMSPSMVVRTSSESFQMVMADEQQIVPVDQDLVFRLHTANAVNYATLIHGVVFKREFAVGEVGDPDGTGAPPVVETTGWHLDLQLSAFLAQVPGNVSATYNGLVSVFDASPLQSRAVTEHQKQALLDSGRVADVGDIADPVWYKDESTMRLWLNVVSEQDQSQQVGVVNPHSSLV